MKKSTLKKYGQYHKCVFHIHTPASHDYTLIPGGTCSKTLIDYAMKIGFLRENFNEIEDFTYKGFKNQHECLSYLLLANKLVDEEIEIAVVTDHNCIDGFCKLADAIKILKEKGGKTLKVFPQIILGIEISCSDKNHVVGIFNHLNSKKELQDWINDYIISPKDGTYLSSLEVLEMINSKKGIGYIAHINSSDIFRKKYLSRVYKERLFNTYSLKILGLSNMDKKISVENSIKNYSDKKFNFILDEDSHSLYELGTKTFWLKTQTLNFEGIKSSLNDFDCSISYSKPTFPDSYVKALYFDGTGFISSKNNTGEGDVLVFSESMNCIIGGRGSGKTTLLNSLNLLISQLVDSSSSLKNALSQGYLCMLYRHEKEVEWQQ